MKFFLGYHTLRWTFAVIGLGVFFVYSFRQEIKEGVGDTGAEVTRRTLEDAGVQLQARELARGVVYELLNDKKALELTTEFLNSLLATMAAP